MARLPNEQTLGKDAMRGITIHIDGSKLDRAAFGWRRWRLWAARKLIGLAATVLRCGIEVNLPDEG